MISRDKFFAETRKSNLFGEVLTHRQVQGMLALLDAFEECKLTDKRKQAAVLATVMLETAKAMYPIKETVMPWHKDRDPSDAEVIKRLDHAFAAGKLPWVKEPYWKDGAFGRGFVMVTHHDNYVACGKMINVDMSKDYSLMLQPEISALVAVKGMMWGIFRKGHSLDAYFNEKTCDPRGARRIINGQDGKDADAEKYYKAFYDVLLLSEVANSAPIVTSQPAQKQSLWGRVKSLF